MSMRVKEDRASAIYGHRAEKNQIFILIAAVFFIISGSGCATVDATVERVKSGVSDRFSKDKTAETAAITDPESASSQIEQPLSDSVPLKPVKKPLLVDIQEKLRTLDYYSGPISGKLDSKTEAAIQDFQLDNDLRIDGRPTESLLEEINKAI